MPSRRSVPLQKIVGHLERVLRPGEFKDWDGAVNGLQLENRGTVTRVAAAVDASLATIRLAAKQRANLLLVHHGLFWSPSHPWTGTKYQLMRELMDNDIAIYSSHLPLDAHPTLGNNAILARELGLKDQRPFFVEKGQAIGVRGQLKVSRKELTGLLARVLGHRPTLLAGGTEHCHSIGIVTGAAGGSLKQAAIEGVDTFITGEGPHWTHALSEELGLNVFYGGHYLTETFGVRALAEEISRRFALPFVFLDHPSGL